MAKLRVGVIGLGNMGRPIAANLLRAGFPTTVFDLRPQAMGALQSAGAQAASSPAAVARRSEILFLVVPDSSAVRQVLFGRNGAAGGAAEGSVVVDMTTGDPHHSKPFADRLARRGIAYLDSPMTGGATGARAGRLLLMVGGDRGVYKRCLPVLKRISKRALHVGPVGSGHVMKLVHNHVSHAVFAATCEGVALRLHPLAGARENVLEEIPEPIAGLDLGLGVEPLGREQVAPCALVRGARLEPGEQPPVDVVEGHHDLYRHRP